MRGCIARKIVTFGLAATAALGVLGTTALPAAAATVRTQAITPETDTDWNTVETATYRCVITADYGWRWEGTCNVYSGRLRTITYCADGSSSTGLWIGARPQAWAVWGNCPGSSWTRIVFQWHS
ncbi:MULTISPECIES: hypothetical protein [Streptomycetaceae]|uniref:hypothetical protein n=1 Tax=Streptomycetaceae TaxID=2062 RepID=UPI00093E0AC0|nr:hypothetical protein [Streptomyces sp. CB02056]OKI03732.1 hypothetical protein AMK13_25610 [Streptomyces sp. CB02056]